jgi:hypothetical protein
MATSGSKRLTFYEAIAALSSYSVKASSTRSRTRSCAVLSTIGRNSA